MTSAADRRRQLGQRSGFGGGSPTQGRFNYQRRDSKALEQRGQTYAQGGRDNFVIAEVQTYSPQKGDNWLRILPPTWEGAKHYGYDVHVHYGIGPDRQAYMCLERGGRGDCPICLERAELARKGMDDAAGELRPTYRIAVYIIDRKAPEKGVQLWTMPYRIDQELVTLAQDKRTGEVLWIDDPDNGYDIEFTRSGEGIHTQYTGVRIARNPSPLENDAALDFAVKHPLPSVFIFSDPENMEKALAGQAAPKPSDSAQAAGSAQAPSAPSRPTLGRRENAPQQPTPSARRLSPEQLMDLALKAADTYNIDIPDAVADKDVPHYVEEKLAAMGKLSEYPDLKDSIPF